MIPFYDSSYVIMRSSLENAVFGHTQRCKRDPFSITIKNRYPARIMYCLKYDINALLRDKMETAFLLQSMKL